MKFMNISKNDIEAIKLWANRHKEILQVWLYGSWARGDNRPDSDIDLAIVMRRDEGQDNAFAVWVFWNKTEKPNLHLSHEVHLEWYEKDAGLKRVGPGFEKDGILLYSVE